MQSPDHSCSEAAELWVRKTLLFRQGEKVRRAIETHKWLESEKLGYDIGWNRAAVDWFVRFGCHDRERVME
ncbi:MAG: hypothetical protein JXB04_03055 [Kiritimatiellae bacterium]|nr:hypothetical protein [Kiritimatiellia bacterium]